MSNGDKWLCICVTDMNTGKRKANVRIPVSLANFGMKMANRFAPADLQGLDMDQIIEAVNSGSEGKLVDVEDQEKGERVEIFVE